MLNVLSQRPWPAIAAIAGFVALVVVGAVLVVAGPFAIPSAGTGPPPGSFAPSEDTGTGGRGPSLPGGAAEWTAVTWIETVDLPFGPADSLLRVEGLVASPDGYLAWGRAPTPGVNQFNDMAAVFLSGDGTDWETVPIVAGVEAPNTSTVVEVAAGPAGYLAIGSVCCEPEHPAAWLSSDGRDWTRISIEGPIQPAGTWFQAVAGIPDGWLVLGGTEAGARSVVWSTADGRTWAAELEVDNGRAGPTISDLAATRTGAVAVGFVVGEDGSYDGAVWTRDGGGSWDRRGIGDAGLTRDETQLWRVVPHAGGFFATGVHGTAEQRRRCEDALGLASLSPVPPPRPAIDATSCSIGDERTWRSADGDAWQLVEPPADVGPIEFRVASAGGPGLVVLGETSGPASPDTVLFGSADGAAWRALVGEPLGQHVASGLAVRGNDVVAITELWTGAEVVHSVWRGVAR